MLGFDDDYATLKTVLEAPNHMVVFFHLHKTAGTTIDLVLAHVGGMDTCARALRAAAYMFEDGPLEAARNARYAGWDREGAKAMLAQPLEVIAQAVEDNNINPKPRSGRQERLENLWNHYI